MFYWLKFRTALTLLYVLPLNFFYLFLANLREILNLRRFNRYYRLHRLRLSSFNSIFDSYFIPRNLAQFLGRCEEEGINVDEWQFARDIVVFNKEVFDKYYSFFQKPDAYYIIVKTLIDNDFLTSVRIELLTNPKSKLYTTVNCSCYLLKTKPLDLSYLED